MVYVEDIEVDLDDAMVGALDYYSTKNSNGSYMLESSKSQDQQIDMSQLFSQNTTDLENMAFKKLGLKEEINAVLSRKEDEEDLTNELTRIDIIKCIQSEKVRFRDVKLSGLDLSKLDLSYVDFSHACLRDVFFSRANLQCAKFRNVDAEGAIFHNAILQECEFTGPICVELY
ncbi:FH protein interacting protein FIP2-like [Humulus lupulus]|uniref:FH protein interacting protein FIP2-like n=1 Tax=Humulus lupulus TaxID=3486 RepID=UPI002B416DBE|nr:FH protein interacting protein FIP2-like [Humulus lupulus]